jgi:hypothetical protein
MEVIQMDEDELASLIVRLLREDREIRQAVLDVVLASPNVVGRV